MSNILTVNNLCKHYPAFDLKDISFSLEEGKITGFIGKNGAGKTTTLKSLFNLVHPDSGSVAYFNMDLYRNENAIKQRVGYLGGSVDYYLQKKLRVITSVTKKFYTSWDDAAYKKYMERFSLDENKTPAQLSAGMKVKYILALALSHNADLFLLDDPTSGLDPISRDDLLDTFMELCNEGKTILFSTHITSDLDKCADRIIYIHNGSLIADSDIDEFKASYRLVEISDEQLTDSLRPVLIGCKRSKHGYSAIVRTEDTAGLSVPCTDADLESIMIHIEKESENE